MTEANIEVKQRKQKTIGEILESALWGEGFNRWKWVVVGLGRVNIGKDYGMIFYDKDQVPEAWVKVRHAPEGDEDVVICELTTRGGRASATMEVGTVINQGMKMDGVGVTVDHSSWRQPKLLGRGQD